MEKVIPLLVVHPFSDAYGDGFKHHLNSIKKDCRNKLTALIFFEPNNNDGFDEDDDEAMEDITAHIAERNYHLTERYWNIISDVVSDVAENFVINLANYLPDIIENEVRANLEQSHAKVNYFKTSSYFLKLFGPIHEIVRDIELECTEVVIVDAYVGVCLKSMYPDKFRLEFAFPKGVDVDQIKDKVGEFVKEYRLFSLWDVESRAYIIGTWNLKNKVAGNFQLYCIPYPKYGKVSGIISDKFGIARFEGKLHRDSFDFEKRYFSFAIKSDQTETINDLPINYELFPATGEGTYAWEVTPERIKKRIVRPCRARILTPIKEG